MIYFIQQGWIIASYFVVFVSSLTINKTRNLPDNSGIKDDSHDLVQQPAHNFVNTFDLDIMKNESTSPGPSLPHGPLVFHAIHKDVMKLANNVTQNVTSPTSAPSPAPVSNFNAGDVVGVVLGVVTLLLIVLTAVLCVRNRRKRPPTQISYIRQENMNDKSPLTTKGMPGRDPVVPRDGDESLQDYYEDDFEREMRLSMSPPRLDLRLRTADPADTDTPVFDRRRSIGADSDVKDGGDVEDEFFYDEVFGTSEFTDERTKSAIKDLSITDIPDDVPDLMFRREDDDFEEIFNTRLS